MVGQFRRQLCRGDVTGRLGVLIFVSSGSSNLAQLGNGFEIQFRRLQLEPGDFNRSAVQFRFGDITGDFGLLEINLRSQPDSDFLLDHLKFPFGLLKFLARIFLVCVLFRFGCR